MEIARQRNRFIANQNNSTTSSNIQSSPNNRTSQNNIEPSAEKQEASRSVITSTRVENDEFKNKSKEDAEQRTIATERNNDRGRSETDNDSRQMVADTSREIQREINQSNIRMLEEGLEDVRTLDIDYSEREIGRKQNQKD